MSTDTPKKEPRVTNRDLKSLIETRIPSLQDMEPAQLMQSEPVVPVSALESIGAIVGGIALLSALTGADPIGLYNDMLKAACNGDPDVLREFSVEEATRDDSDAFETVRGMGIALSPNITEEALVNLQQTIVGKPINDHVGEPIGNITKAWMEDGQLMLEGRIQKGTVPGIMSNLEHVPKIVHHIAADPTEEGIKALAEYKSRMGFVDGAEEVKPLSSFEEAIAHFDREMDSMFGASPLKQLLAGGSPFMRPYSPLDAFLFGSELDSVFGHDFGRSDSVDAMRYAMESVKPKTPAQLRTEAIGRINLSIDFTKTDTDYRYAVATNITNQSGFMTLEDLKDYMYYDVFDQTLPVESVNDAVYSMIEQTEEIHYAELKSVGLEGTDNEVREFNGTWYKYVGNEVKRTYFYGNGTKHIIPAPKWLWVNPDGKSHRIITSGRTTHRVTLEGCVDIAWKVKKGSALSSF